MPPLPSVPTVDGPAIIVDSDGVVDVVNGDKAARNGSVPGLLNDSISSACTDELHVSAEQTPTGTNISTKIGAGPAVDMEVMGIYKRGSVPREAELPKDYVLKDCQQDQVMVRQRLQTRPLLDDAEDEHDLIEEEEVSDSSSDSSDDSSDGSDADDESGNKTKKQQKQKKKKMSKQSKKERTSKSLRRRLKSKAADGTEYDVAMFQPEQGLVMRKSDWPFYHADLSEHSDSSDDERVSALISCSFVGARMYYVSLATYSVEFALVCSITLIILSPTHTFVFYPNTYVYF